MRLTQAQIAELFQTTPQNVMLPLKAIFVEGELTVEETCQDDFQVRVEGSREVTRSLRHYEAGGQPCQGLCTVRPAMCSDAEIDLGLGDRADKEEIARMPGKPVHHRLFRLGPHQLR